MELRKLDAFCKVIELKSFTRAAKAMLLSQPTISEHIRYLESELNQKLLERQGREVEPTPVGAVLYAYAKRILQTRREAIQAVEQFSGKLSGRIAIGCGTIPGTYILPELVGAFYKKYPAIKTTLHINSSRLIAEEVLVGNLELGVVGAKWNEPGLYWNQIFSDELTLVVYQDHPWVDKETVSLAEIMGEPIITRERGSGTRKVFSRILMENGFREQDLQEVAEIGSTAAVKEAVKAGLGVAILSKRAVRDEIQCGRLSSIAIKDQKLTRPFYLIQRKNRELSPVASAFQEFILEKSNAIKNE
jgi:DNA-binding transcriptional LysR family regulator